MDIKSEKFVTPYEARKILKKKSKEMELNYEQKNAFDYLNKFCRIAEKDIEALSSELRGVEKLNDKHIVGIVGMMPKDDEDLRLLFANERIVLADDDKKKIIAAVKKHVK